MAPGASRAPRALEERGVVAVGDEADLVAVRLVGDGEAEPRRMRADGGLVERADREQRVRELLLRQREEEVRLILGGDRRRASAGTAVAASRSTRA